jgi:hypothetical protein
MAPKAKALNLKFIFVLVILGLAGPANSQNLDSLIGLRKTEFFSGKIPTWC